MVDTEMKGSTTNDDGESIRFMKLMSAVVLHGKTFSVIICLLKVLIYPICYRNLSAMCHGLRIKLWLLDKYLNSRGQLAAKGKNQNHKKICNCFVKFV
jgi:hypothetical protein